MSDSPFRLDDDHAPAGPRDVLERNRSDRTTAFTLERPYASRYAEPKSSARNKRRSTRSSRKEAAEAAGAAAFARAEAVRERVNAIDPAIIEGMLLSMCMADPTFDIANVPD